MPGKKRKLEVVPQDAWTTDWQMTAFIMSEKKQKRYREVSEDHLLERYEWRREKWSEFLKDLKNKGVIEFVGCGLELCPETQLYHEQSVICLKKITRFPELTTILKDWRSPHVEPLITTPSKHWKDYCLKSTKHPVITHGDLPSRRGYRCDLARVHHLANLNLLDPITTFQDGRPLSLQQLNLLEKLIQTRKPPRTWKTKVHWFYGETGCGKSETAMAQAGPGHYRVPEYGGRGHMDNYRGQTSVVWEEFSYADCKFKLLLKICDKYPLTLGARYYDCNWIPKDLYITSREHPRKIFEKEDDASFRQLERRIERILWFKEKGKFVVEKNAKVQESSEEEMAALHKTINEEVAKALQTFDEAQSKPDSTDVTPSEDALCVSGGT